MKLKHSENKMKTTMLATAMCAAGLASAQTVNFDANPMADFRAALKDAATAVAVPASKASPAPVNPGDEIKPENVAAEGIGEKGGEISGAYLSDTRPALKLVVGDSRQIG